MLKSQWNAVMDPDRNGLLKLPKTVRFQMMVVLALMWSIIFLCQRGAARLVAGLRPRACPADFDGHFRHQLGLQGRTRTRLIVGGRG